MKKEKINISSQTILDELEKKDIKQIPRWIFITKNVAFWIFWIVFVVFGGSLAVCSVIFHIQFSGWEYYPITHGSLGTFLIDAVPYVWIALFLIFLVVGYENIRHTKRGYRYAFSAVIALSLFASITGGSFLYILGTGRFIDEHIGAHIPFDRKPPGLNKELWDGSEKGLLAGTILSVNQDSGQFTLQEFNNSQWVVDTTQLSDENWSLIEQGSEIRVVGLPYSDGDELFVSCFVFPWEDMPEPRSEFNHDFLPPRPCDDCQITDMQDIESCEDVPTFDFLR
ncbi:MAG: hypothetical protein ABIA83_03235 [Patescibacteria group bacterium]